MTSPEPGLTRPTSAQAFQALVPVMAPGRLNEMVGALERELVGADRNTALARVRSAPMNVALLDAALTVRRDVGRLNDVIHALAIGLALERSSNRAKRSPRHRRWLPATMPPHSSSTC